MVREFALFISPQELLDTSLGQLWILIAFLKDHLPADGQRAGSPALEEARVCAEIMRSLDELVARSARLRPRVN